MPHNVPWVFWPFWALWKLLAGVIKLTGRLAAVIGGLAFLITGVILCFTIIGLPFGIPLTVAGFLLMLRGLF